MYRSVVEFVEAIGQWVEESLLQHLYQAQYFSLMADKCTEISTIAEICRWVEDGITNDALKAVKDNYSAIVLALNRAAY